MTSQPIKVLIVEDTSEHARLLEHILSAATYPRFHTAIASNLAEALAALSLGGIDAILLDLTLPDSLPGHTFSAVNAVAPDIAVVIISGVSDVSRAIELVQAGAQDYLIKGQVDHNLLLRSLQYSVERKRAQVALRQANDQLETRVHERTAELVNTNKRLQIEIAERKRAQEAVAASNEQLTQALAALRAAQQELVHRERLTALGTMANGIAHEFNNVLTPIIGWTEHLLRKPEDLANNETTRDTIQKIQTAANVGAAAVGRVREFARTEADAYGQLVLTDIVEQAIAFTEPKWQHEAQASGVMIDIRKRFEPIPEVHGEASQLRELITLLLFNAIAAIPRRGSISLITTQREDFVVLTVRDDGLGMSKLTRERCLDPNLGARHPDGRSSGFGIIHGILQRHGGKLEIESEEGRGSKVSILIPIALAVTQPPALAPVPPPAPEAPIVRTGKRILLAEDDAMVREVMELYLTEYGFSVTLTSNGREGIDEFTRAHGGYDLLITDRAMPEMNGDQVALAAKQINPDIPVILLTGCGGAMNSEGEKPPGVDLVVGKPFTMSSLREALGKVGF